MPDTFSIIPVLYLIGAAQGAFLALALFSHRGGNRKANRYLGLLTLVFVAALIDYFMDVTGLTESYVWLRTLLWPKEFLYGILIYFYTRELTLPGEYRLRGRQWLHFVPFFLHVTVSWPLLLLDANRQFLILTDQAEGGMDGFLAGLLGDFELYITIVQITIYLVLSLRLIQAHDRRIRRAVSDVDKISLRWLSWLVTGIIVVYLIWLVEELMSQWLHQEAVWDALLGGSMVVLIYSMGYLGLRQPLIFSGSAGDTDADADAGSTVLQFPVEEILHEEQKYRNSPISDELGESLLQELLRYMTEHKPFLDSDISLPTLADRLAISINYLSQVINQQTGKNFFDFINSYRIGEATALLAQDSERKLNILNLSMEVGFNSKSAFYNAFKKHTGMTPTQYRAQLVETGSASGAGNQVDAG